MSDLPEVVRLALASFKRLDEGASAPRVSIQIDGEHMTASWVDDHPENDKKPVEVHRLEGCA